MIKCKIKSTWKGTAKFVFSFFDIKMMWRFRRRRFMFAYVLQPCKKGWHKKVMKTMMFYMGIFSSWWRQQILTPPSLHIKRQFILREGWVLAPLRRNKYIPPSNPWKIVMFWRFCRCNRSLVQRIVVRWLKLWQNLSKNPFCIWVTYHLEQTHLYSTI